MATSSSNNSNSDTVLVDGISRALGVPRPFVHEPNAALTLVEDWRELTCLVATEPIAVKPVGYYRSPESVDIYVFECSMGTGGDAKTWKIYRRYRQFQQYVSRSSELLADMVVPRLSQAYLKIFYAKQCKDRLIELHAWLTGVIENTQRFFETATAAQPTQAAPETDPRAWLRTELARASQAAMPALWLCAFLFAGANTPFPHYFRGLPVFALALEEVNIALTKAPIFPSKLRSSIETTAGLGLRLTPTREVHGAYTGATVSGFLRGAAELDASLAAVQVGAKLVRINGVDVTDMPFDAVLSQLRSVGLPLRLRFVYNPYGHRRERSKSYYASESGGRGSIDATTMASSPPRDGPPLRARRFSSAASTVSNSTGSRSLSGHGAADAERLERRALSISAAGSASASTTSRPPSRSNSVSLRPKDALQRRYSMDSRQSIGIFRAVFGDLFGRKRHETADALLATHIDTDDDALCSWDDVTGDVRDIHSRGFFSLLSHTLLHELRMKDRLAYDDSALVGKAAVDGASSKETEAALKALSDRKAQGIWSTSTGPLGLAFGACKLHGVEAAMLELPPQFYSARLGYLGSEKHLGKGFVLVSINNESTFGMTFAAVMRALTKASRPTAVCFRWFQDYSPFLETELAERQQPQSSSSHKLAPPPPLSPPPKAFDHALACLAEAQTDLCTNLHLALVENASIRNDTGRLHDAQRASAAAQARAEETAARLSAQASAQAAQIAQLQRDLASRDTDIAQLQDTCHALDARLASAKSEYHKLLDAAHASAKTKVAEHEERLVRESNKSIETARVIAERAAKKALDAALSAQQQRHDEYLQKLAEEHSEEVESLMQQVVVWRHQVEVLTEAEKRNYAAMIHNGVNPYHDYQRSRFGFADAPFGSGSTMRDGRSDGASAASGFLRSTMGNASSSSNSKPSERTLGASSKSIGTTAAPTTAQQQQQQQMEYESWRDGTPEDPSSHTFSDLSDRVSPSAGGHGNGTAPTFWSAWFRS